MPVIPEERVFAYLGRCLELSAAVAPFLAERGTCEIPDGLRGKFERLVADLQGERAADSRLDAEAWNWIWKGKQRYNYLQVYGRLAWLNLQIFDLL
ncbi:MAG TPA: hypothetical protein PKX48_12470 [Planctomycetota bacterium]|jgi:hypothetical protein|nr:hypothetical protein [Planctomycetota bacterium]OQC22164.1 MAG: hypothetical protein BWX69_00015 [Planctomycetes bacterium ADurb.Bin069]HNR99728.1 hypothetical protein [Planctomycetota bacterium]HNU25347.1 hypothetical protein [Planctomycetota bacterium]HOE29384.1 hypothetical protein [Planctomycetota bacterium]